MITGSTASAANSLPSLATDSGADLAAVLNQDSAATISTRPIAPFARHIVPFTLAEPRWVVLRRDGVCLVFRYTATGLPAVSYWGADLGILANDDLVALDQMTLSQTPPGTLDTAWWVPLVPQEADGWAGRPGLQATVDGVLIYPRWRVTSATTNSANSFNSLESIATADYADSQSDKAIRADQVTFIAIADESMLKLELNIEIGAGGLVAIRQSITNTAPAQPVGIDYLEATLPVPVRADHLTTFSGRWTREKQPQTTSMPRGSTVRQARRGRGGHDAPWVTLASVGPLHNRTGEIWAVHCGWSADVTHRVDRLSEQETYLGAGEFLRPGEILLAPGETYQTPTTYFAWSDRGLDGVQDRFHTWVRARAQHPKTNRPLTLNTWEAVYFDHSPQRLSELARKAAAVGVERFVVDDGWFLGRRDDTTSLGDWEVDPDVYPDGLKPVADLVHQLGMQFGLWFEPEMVSLDSNLARQHPDWLLGNPDSIPSPAGISYRQQYVLDLANPAAFGYIFDRISALITELDIDFIKYDHNRDLVEPVHDGRPGTHAQTLAFYRLASALKAAHPGLEIESCSSGGARTDLGALAVTDRVWPSDSNDPVERLDIQRWTELVLPPELIGAHIGPSPAHATGRHTDLLFRAVAALQGSAGFEWDIMGCDRLETQQLHSFTALYRRLRGLLHTGTVVHPDTMDPALRVRGVIAPDGSAALFTIATVASLEESQPERIQLVGLDPHRRYQLQVVRELGDAKWGWITPPWLADGTVTASGKMLTEIGLQIPALLPNQALMLHLQSV